MSSESLYKEALLQHYRHPSNKSDDGLADADIVRRGSNPRCGDEIEVGLYLEQDYIKQVKFRGRGCSICIASASMMTEVVADSSQAEADELCHHVTAWFSGESGDNRPEPPATLLALSAVRQHRARHKCVLLSWEALSEALADIPSNSSDHR